MMSLIRGGSNLNRILMAINGSILPHYSIEYRKHFTDFHATVVDTAGGFQMGATEGAIIMIASQWVTAFLEDQNKLMIDDVDFTYFKAKKGTLLLFFTCYLSVQYNFGNFYEGFTHAKNRLYSIKCFFPFLMCYLMIIPACLYSNYFKSYPGLFLVYIGFFISTKTAKLNLATCSKAAYNPFSFEPVVFFLILYLDIQKYDVFYFYVALLFVRMTIYFSFVISMIN